MNKLVLITLYSLLLRLLVGRGTQRFNCSYRWQAKASYDLTPLRLSYQPPYYRVQDIKVSPKSTQAYFYYFNFCDAVLTPPASICTTQNSHYYCDPLAKNTNINGTFHCQKQIAITQKVGAYQVAFDSISAANNPEKNAKHCWPLTNEHESHEWSLLNEKDPAQGVMLTFKNGQMCSKGQNREFRLGLQCDDNAWNVPNVELAREWPTCVYALNFSTIYGCPRECGRTTRLCDGQGSCEYDWSNDRPRCFCYWGFDGESCDKAVSQTMPTRPQITRYGKCIKTFHQRINNIDAEVTYNLEKFDLSSQLSVFRFDDPKGEYDYFLNLCSGAKASILPLNCTKPKKKLMGPCKDLTKSCNGTNMGKLSTKTNAGYQASKSGDRCYVIGQTNFEETKLLDALDPTRGVVVTYSGGGYCPGSKVNRSIEVTLKCPDSPRLFYDPESIRHVPQNVTENKEQPCKYFVHVEHALACPSECIFHHSQNQFTVCGGKGVCSFDPNVKFVRCLCDKGYSGKYCLTKLPTSVAQIDSNPHTSWKVAVTLLVILGIGLFVAAGYYFYRHRVTSQRLDTLRKSILENSDSSIEHPEVGYDMKGVGINIDDLSIPDDYDNDRDIAMDDIMPTNTTNGRDDVDMIGNVGDDSNSD